MAELFCHTGRESCFIVNSRHKVGEIVDAQLKDPTAIYGASAKVEAHDHGQAEQVDVLSHRSFDARTQKLNPDSSYVASLYKKGINKILEKSAKKVWKALLQPRLCSTCFFRK